MLYLFNCPKIGVHYKDLRAIPQLISQGKYAAGIIINESMGRLAEYNLTIKYDLANYGYEKTGTPLPLGLVATSENLSKNQQQKFESDVRASLYWAQSNHARAVKMAEIRASEKDPETIEAHINSFTSYADGLTDCQGAISAFMAVADPYRSWSAPDMIDHTSSVREKENIGKAEDAHFS
ncbi:MAG: hypothetical protein H6618_08735 [Deltaproteobacteria bacterium]|nr:hypothetical protein [Deltaproteobacteria bacterium]